MENSVDLLFKILRKIREIPVRVFEELCEGISTEGYEIILELNEFEKQCLILNTEAQKEFQLLTAKNEEEEILRLMSVIDLTEKLVYWSIQTRVVTTGFNGMFVVIADKVIKYETDVGETTNVDPRVKRVVLGEPSFLFDPTWLFTGGPSGKA